MQRRYLVREGYDVVVETDPGAAATMAAETRPDVVVLDLSTAALPIDLYRRVVDAARPAPVIAVTPPGDAVLMPGLGEHRVTRPFGPRLLVGVVAEALRQGEPVPASGLLNVGAVTLDPDGRGAAVGEHQVALTVTEFDLLEFLMRNPGRVFTREQLLEAAWAPGAGAGSRTVDVHIAQLRAKLGAGSPIRTVRGVGYVLDA
ncbi:response regulator transcription factor [Actinomadura barringtoniae]|uniref:Response regulator transcription factor n=2 Tax=Actinomadura barringtoniae TaxID=1427535 RepID=A0A939PIF9_9ACTN|nr:response regulator transcription factor [Actinomadura barringtoniae]